MKFALFFLTAVLAFCCSFKTVFAAVYSEFSTTTAVVLGEFVYNDDFSPTTTPCYIQVYNPGGSLNTDTLMSADSNGWHYISLLPTTTVGTYPSSMHCGATSTGDFIRQDKTFRVINDQSSASASELASAVWNADERTLTNLSTSSIAEAVWSNTNRTLSDYATSSIASAVWSNGTRSLTTFGSLIADIWANPSRTISSFGALAADIWNGAYAPTRNLTDASLSSGSLATLSDVNSSSSTIASAVWSNTNRTLSDYATSSIASAVWSNGTRSLTTFGSLIADIWANPSRTISSFGALAADIWNGAYAPTRNLTDASLSSGSLATLSDVNSATTTATTAINANTNLASTSLAADIAINKALIEGIGSSWVTSLSDTASIMSSKSYRAKLYVSNLGELTDSLVNPLISIYDVNRNLVVSSVTMTKIATGIYEYVYLVPNGAEQGNWETIINTEVESGQVIQTNDYWEVRGSPAQVIINSVSDLTVPSIAANITITNEGLSGYEYQYEWCVVSSANNACGDNDDIFHATAAKYINAAEDWNTTLTATVPSAGDYIFKLIVYFGTESSGSSRSFTAASSGTTSGGGGGGGGGGAGATTPAPVVITTPAPSQETTSTTSTEPVKAKRRIADLNDDGRVNAVDFSILLAFYKTRPPFANPYADMNIDNKVDAVDFSILLSDWDKK